MGEVVIHKTKDRVSVAYDRTINIGNYESVKVHSGYSTDVQKDETVDEAFARADEFATKKLEELCAPVEEKVQRKGKK
jgi:hypothetical protein